MTKKGTLRVVGHLEAAGGWAGGALVDETFDAAAVRQAIRGGSCIDADAFLHWLGPRLGMFRIIACCAAQTPSVAEETALVNEALVAIEQVRVRLESLPPSVAAYVDVICWKARRELFFEFQRRIGDDLRTAGQMLDAALEELAQYAGRAGAKPKQSRDEFLHDVAHWLQDASVPKEQAAGIAAAVLRAVGVDAPEDPRKARDLVRKVEHG